MRVLVVDDEPVARRRILRLLAGLDDVEVVGEAANGREALALVTELAPEVLLLDIDMPELDGLAVAEDPRCPPVIFTTAHRDYAAEAFDADAHDYLVKPIAKERLARALEKVRRRAVVNVASIDAEASEPWRLVVIVGALKRFVDARTVDCFIADQKYVAFRAENSELLVRESLDTLAERLGPYGFLRVNRGALVRREAIAAWDSASGGSVVLTDGQRVPVSRRAIRAVKAALGL